MASKLQVNQFIQCILPSIQKYAPKYNIKVYSPILAQAILESDSGQSELAKKALNFFGLKYNPKQSNRCPSASGYYIKVGSEQNASNGEYTSSVMLWQKFNSIDNAIHGYFEFLNYSSRYDNLKNVTSPKIYLENLKNDGYATSIKYVENLMNVIREYNLTQYDPNNKMTINIHAGHAKANGAACGAVGIINESIENRIIKDMVIKKLKALEHTVYDCTVDDNTTQNDVLNKIVKKCNTHKVNLDISIHFNSGAKDLKGNGQTTGVEVFTYPNSSVTNIAKEICNNISALGFKNRGVKTSNGLFVLKHCQSPSLLIEVCFVDDYDDVKIYNSNKEKIANAIVSAITGTKITSVSNTIKGNSSTTLPLTQNTTMSTKKISELNIKKGDVNQFSTIIKNIKIALNNEYKLKFAIDTSLNDVLFINLENIVLNTALCKKKNELVYVLQQLLKWWGYDLAIDGYFGNGTKNILIVFQKALKLNPTGTTSKETWKKLLGK